MVNEKSNLTEIQINEIFSLYENNVSMLKISKLYNTSATLIQNLIVSKGFETKISKNYPQRDNRITGIANRLLKHFIENYSPSKIISFADIRWTPNSNKNLYIKLGFKLSKTLPPDYSYFKSNISRYGRLHKFGFGKSNLKRKFPEIYDDSKTEWEMMQELGYDRIWDCGKYKYELNVKI